MKIERLPLANTPTRIQNLDYGSVFYPLDLPNDLHIKLQNTRDQNGYGFAELYDGYRVFDSQTWWDRLVVEVRADLKVYE